MKKLTLFLVLLTALLGLKQLAQAQTCQPPANISVTTPTTYSALVNFNPVAGATSYTVRYWWTLDSTATNAQTMTVTSPPATISGLQYPAYRVTVTSNCTATTGATSNPVTFQFPGATCGTPDSVQATVTSNTTVNVRWNAVSGATSYMVRVYLAGTTTLVASVPSTNNSITTVHNLQPGTNYIVRVYSICGAGVSPQTAGVPFRTTSGGTTPTGCDSVRNVRATNITTTSATIAFTHQPGVSGYIITYQQQNNPAGGWTTVTTNLPPMTISGLQPNTPYTVVVRANCAVNTLSPPGIRGFVTLAPAPPCGAVSNVVVTASSDSTATVSFTPGQNNTSFHITYHLLNDSTRWVNTNASPVTIAGLIPGNTYYIQVTSLCGNATGTVYTPGNNLSFGFRGTSALATRAALGAGSIAAYPNPAHHAVSLSLPAVAGASQAQVTLLNAVGQQVRSSSVALGANTTRAELDLTGVAPGLYTVRVVAGGQAASQRLVVE